jgi:hypothetical protein
MFTITHEITTTTSISAAEKLIGIDAPTIASHSYQQIVTIAADKYLRGTHRRYYGTPKPAQIKPLTNEDKAFIENIKVNTVNEKYCRKLITNYFNAQCSNLKRPFSFASYLLGELMKWDQNLRGKLQFYINKPTIQYKNDMTLFHGSHVSPQIIFEEGLIAKIPVNYFDCREAFFAKKTWSTGVSTTFDISKAYVYATEYDEDYEEDEYNNGEYIYVIDYQGKRGLNIDSTLKMRSNTPEGISEINIGECISREQIQGAYKYIGKKNWYFIINKNYKGTKPVPANMITDQKLSHPNFSQPTIDKIATSANQVLERVEHLITKTTTENKWIFGFGGSTSNISIYGKTYRTPNGIKEIWEILTNNSISAENKISLIHKVATSHSRQKQSFFGARTPSTIWRYNKIKDYTEGYLEKGYSRSKPPIIS